MDKKKVAVIALILFFGLGTFVFANPSELKEERTASNEDSYSETESNTDDINDTVVQDTKDLAEDTRPIYDEVTAHTFVRDKVNINQALDFIILDNTTTNSNGNGTNQDGNHSSIDSGGNQSGGSTSDKDDENGSNKPESPDPSNPSGGDSNQPTDPEKPVDPSDKDEEEIKEQYEQIKKLVETLQNKVMNAKNKDDILQAKIYRDTNAIYAQVQVIKDEKLKQELVAILNDVDSILNDVTVPVISGVTHKAYYKENVVLTIDEAHLREIKVNGNAVSLNQTLQFMTEGTYEVVVVDAAFNKTTVTFTIDKTAPVLTVTTSNNGTMTNQDVIVYVHSNEPLKPVNGWVISSDKKELSKVFKVNTKDVLTVEDFAGNQASVSYEVFDINRDIPAVSSDDIHYSTTTLTNGDVVVTITTNKDIFTPDGWEMVSGSRVFTKTYKQNTKEKVSLKDGYKNICYVTIEITNIDKIPPVAVFVIDSNKTNQSVIGKIVANEPIKEVEGWISSTDGKEIMRAFDENEKGSVIIEDLAGNQAVVKYVVQNIDKEVSDIKVTTSNNLKPTNKDVIVTISSSEELEKVPGWLLSDDKKSISKVFSENIKSTVVVQDKVGNRQEVEYEVFDIDKTPPQIFDIEYSLTSDNKIMAMIKTTKAVFTPASWTMVKDSKIFTKIYEESTTENIRLKDSYRNRLNFVINIDVDEIRNNLLNSKQRVVNSQGVMNAISPVITSINDIAFGLAF